MNPDLPKIIKFAKSESAFMAPGAGVCVNTSLNDLPDPVALLESGVDLIRISISGMTQKVYSKNHRGGNIESVLNNILRLTNARKLQGIENVILRLVFHDYVYNKEDAKIAKKFCGKHGLEFELLRAHIPCVEDNIEFQKNRERLSEFYKNFIDLDREMSLMRTIDSAGVRECSLRRDFIIVNFDGRLYRCCGIFQEKYFLGSIFDYNIKDILEIDSEICKKCAITPMSWR